MLTMAIPYSQAENIVNAVEDTTSQFTDSIWFRYAMSINLMLSLSTMENG